MTVYVDNMRAPYRRMIMCHMIADSESELHAMAARVGVARRWYQGDHYDICLAKRALAVRYGAQEITLRELAKKAIAARKGKRDRELRGATRQADGVHKPKNERARVPSVAR